MHVIGLLRSSDLRMLDDTVVLVSECSRPSASPGAILLLSAMKKISSNAGSFLPWLVCLHDSMSSHGGVHAYIVSWRSYGMHVTCSAAPAMAYLQRSICGPQKFSPSVALAGASSSGALSSYP